MKHLPIAILALVLFTFSLEGGYTIYKGKIVNSNQVPLYSVDTHYRLGVEAMELDAWDEAAYHFNVITVNFPSFDFYYESKYYLAVCYFYEKEYDFANEAFSEYLNCQNNPLYFEEAISYKLQIADAFRCGAKKRCFGTKMLPKWAPAGTLALEIYDEVITSLPCHDFAAQSLYAKGFLLWENQDFKESVDAFQMLIRRFPKHELAPASYLCINEVYLDQAQTEFQNPDILALAQVNYKKFQRDFPKDENLQCAADNVQAIKEFYARGLWETGQFYERIERPRAAAIYYASAIQQFPDTSFARCCEYRLSVVAATCSEVELCEQSS